MSTAPAYSRVRKQPRPSARCGSHKAGQNAKRTPPPSADGFLRQRFLPLTTLQLPSAKMVRVLEEGFFMSLKNLAALYNFEPPDVTGHVFPYNIFAAHAHAAATVKSMDAATQLLILSNENHAAVMAAAKALDTGTTLYYIPVEPLLVLLKQKERKQTAELLLSVFTYLYKVAEMPFCDSSSFTGYIYEMIKDCMEEEPEAWEDEQEYRNRLSEIKAVFRYGKIIKEHISKPCHLEQFALRVQQFIPANDAERALHGAATVILGLFNKYPCRSFFDNIHEQLLHPETEERIHAGEYFSFYWSHSGWLHDEAMENINCSLQEMNVIEEPVVLQCFDTLPETIQHDMDFESRLLDAVCGLADALNNF